MRKLLFFLLALTACDDGFIHVQERNGAPVITIVGFKEGAVSIVQKVKLTGEKSAQYTVGLQVSDENENLSGFAVEILSGGEKMKMVREGKPLQANVFYAFAKKRGREASDALTFELATAGKTEVALRVKDTFEKMATVTIAIEAVANVRPVAVLEIEKGNPGEYILDGTASYDSDADLGGVITNYEYTFLDRKVVTRLDKLPVDFPGKGTYEVGLRVQDNDFVWSGTAVKVIKI